jgi:hypothetical protein
VQLIARIVCRMVALGNPSVPAESKPLRNLAHARSASFQLASKSGLRHVVVGYNQRGWAAQQMCAFQPTCSCATGLGRAGASHF